MSLSQGWDRSDLFSDWSPDRSEYPDSKAHPSKEVSRSSTLSLFYRCEKENRSESAWDEILTPRKNDKARVAMMSGALCNEQIKDEGSRKWNTEECRIWG